MRILSLLLVSLVMALIFQPAVSSLAYEEDGCCENSCEKTTDEQEIPNGPCTEKNCNPFAYCCYSMGYNINFPVQYVSPVVLVKTPVLSFHTIGSSTYFAKFWQPPQSC